MRHDISEHSGAVNRDWLNRWRGSVLGALVPLLVLTGTAVFERLTEGQPFPWKAYVGFSAFWLLWSLLAVPWWIARAHARTDFGEEGITFVRASGKSQFIPWHKLKRVRRARLLCVWVFYTDENRVRLSMNPFRTWVVDGIILDHVPPDCELVGRFRNWESVWD